MTTTQISGISRRGFIKGSALVTGGLTFGFVIPGSKTDADAAGNIYTPNAWVHIADNNEITLISHQSEMGQGVYTSLPMLIAEELNVDVSKVKVSIAPPGAQYVNALLGAQITGGSTSVRGAWEKLRLGGAQVREMLISAAADKWKVDRSQITANNGILQGPGGKKATYGSLASAASKLPIPEKVALKDPSAFRIVGKPTKRLDTPMKTNGTAEFGIDVKVPGMLYAATLPSPVLGGKVKSVDDAAAKKMPGVVAIVPMGDSVGIIADTYWHARKAREVLKVDWDEGPAANISNQTIADALRKAAADGKALPIQKPVGDPDGAMKTAAKVIKGEYWSQLLSHSPIEPMNFTADYRGGKMHLIGPTQFQQGAVGAVSAVLGIKPEDITVKTTFLGGGFGRRIELDFIVQAATLSKAVGKPVKMIWTREDDMTHDWYRPMAVNNWEVGVDDKGMPVALKFKITSESITQRAFALPKDTLDPFIAEAAVAGYKIPNSSHLEVIQNSGIWTGYLRSVSHPFNVFANEGMMDELAANAGKDPIDYRMSLLDPNSRYAKVLKMVREKSGWDTPAPAGRSRGVALMEGYQSYLAMVAEASVEGGKPKIHRVVTVIDCGQMVNPDTVDAQIMSSVVFGLTSALMNEITVEKGRVQQKNFDTYPLMRMNEVPVIETHLVQSTEPPGGVGEPAMALSVAAAANAVSKASGKRIRSMPIKI